jgi:hypothetical protein
MRKILFTVPLMAASFFLLMGASDCEGEPPPDNGFQENQQDTINEYQEQLDTAVPYPIGQMVDSLERRQIRERLLRFNDPNKIGYVYLFAETGQLISFYTVKGKVSSTESMMTTTSQVVCYKENIDDVCLTVDSPGDYGSFGPNENGVFFFTTEGVLVTWNGTYLYLDAPLQVTTEPLVIYDESSATPSSAIDIRAE